MMKVGGKKKKRGVMVGETRTSPQPSASAFIFPDVKTPVGRATPQIEETVTEIPERVSHHKPTFRMEMMDCGFLRSWRLLIYVQFSNYSLKNYTQITLGRILMETQGWKPWSCPPVTHNCFQLGVGERGREGTLTFLWIRWHLQAPENCPQSPCTHTILQIISWGL